jgi:hypothetical protein
MTTTSSPPAVAFDKVSFAFDDLVVLRDGEILYSAGRHDRAPRCQRTVTQLLASKDPYLTEFLYLTLPPW